jgi:Polyketide cyclase / dehydrase and lipid transport
MSKPLAFRVEQRSSVKAAAVYDTFLDVESWPEWMPSVSAASWERPGAPDTGIGGVRLVRMRGSMVRDEITGGTRPHHHAYTTTLPGFWPVKDYRGDIRIAELANGSLIIWTATFRTSVPGLGKPLQLMLRSLIVRLSAALAQGAA